jgi:hypothetical protein
MLPLLALGATAVAAQPQQRSRSSPGMPLALSACSPGVGNQRWELTLVPPYTSPAGIASMGVCLDLAEYRTTALRARPPSNLARLASRGC